MTIPRISDDSRSAAMNEGKRFAHLGELLESASAAWPDRIAVEDESGKS
jgi:hypothetical protein